MREGENAWILYYSMNDEGDAADFIVLYSTVLYCMTVILTPAVMGVWSTLSRISNICDPSEAAMLLRSCFFLRM